jgi:predicted chitinase
MTTISLAHPSTRLLIDACKTEDLPRNQCAYVLATAWHESGQYQYMREIWGPTAAQRRYEGRTDLGNVQKGDGRKFLGRGFCQITGRRNYTDWSRRLGLDLLKEPQLAERPDIAAKIIVLGMKLGTFTSKKLANYITLSKSDFVNARRIINGMDRADLIAHYAQQYDDLLLADQYGQSAQQPAPPAPAPPVQAPKTPAAAPAREPQPLPTPSSKKPVAAVGILVLIGSAVAYRWHELSAWLHSFF